MFAFVVCFSFSVLSQDSGWEERPQNDLFCVGWDVNQSINIVITVAIILLVFVSLLCIDTHLIDSHPSHRFSLRTGGFKVALASDSHPSDRFFL